jgi:hypothetical protein
MADSFTRLDPSTIPAEARPFYDSMQADYTRKMQEAAPYRKLAEETGLDVDGLRNSAELYAALQDPQQIVQFHSELTDALRAQGLTQAEATAAATTHVQETLAGGEDLSSLDPEEQRIQALEARLASFEQQAASEAEVRQNEIRAGQIIARLNQEEQLIKEQNPTWTQEDIDGSYKLAAYFGGDLVAGANAYAEITSAHLTRVLNGKGAAQNNPALAPLPAAVPGLSRGMDFGGDLDAAHKAAMAAAKLLP